MELFCSLSLLFSIYYEIWTNKQKLDIGFGLQILNIIRPKNTMRTSLLLTEVLIFNSYLTTWRLNHQLLLYLMFSVNSRHHLDDILPVWCIDVLAHGPPETLCLCLVSLLSNPSMATAQCISLKWKYFCEMSVTCWYSLHCPHYACRVTFHIFRLLPDMSSAPGAAAGAAAAAAAVASPPVDSGRSTQYNIPKHTVPGQSRMSHSHRSIRAKKG